MNIEEKFSSNVLFEYKPSHKLPRFEQRIDKRLIRSKPILVIAVAIHAAIPFWVINKMAKKWRIMCMLKSVKHRLSMHKNQTYCVVIV